MSSIVQLIALGVMIPTGFIASMVLIELAFRVVDKILSPGKEPTP